MTKKVVFKLSREGVRHLMSEDAMQAILEELAYGISQRCGAGFEVTTYVGKSRANASVHAATAEAYFRNLHGNTILKAMK